LSNYKSINKKQAIIYGLGNFAEYAAYVLTQDSSYNVCAFCIEAAFNTENSQTFSGLPIIDFNSVQEQFPPEDYHIFIAVGNNWAREKIFHASKHKGYSFVSYLSSKTTLWDNLDCGEHVFIGEGTIIQPFVSIGANTIVLASNIGHHSQIGCHILLSGCYLAGNVSVGSYSFIGINSTIQQNIVIGQKNIIGMRSNMTRNTNDNEVYREKQTKKSKISSDKFIDKYLS